MIEFIIENKQSILNILLIIYTIMSLITLGLYAIDKLKAKYNGWRIKEKTLLLFPWFFGSLGGLLGVYLLRHKTKHWYFIINNVTAFTAHLFLLAYIVIL